MNDSFSVLKISERFPSVRKGLPYVLLLGVTFVLYRQALTFNFVWDDGAYIHKNYRMQGLDWVHVQAFWTHTYLGHYAPLHHTVLALLYHFSGLKPFGYHLGQLLLHAACVCLLYFVLSKMEEPRVALLASLLFAVHPTSIETVAWISETKSTLALLLFLLSLWFFLRLREQERWRDGVLCALFLILSILAKINTIVAPAIFLLYDYKQKSSFRGRKLWSLASFFLISMMFVGVHLRAFHGSSQAMESQYYVGPGVHWMNLPLLLAFYVRMIVFPYPLSAWEMFPIQTQFNWLIALGWAGLLGIPLLLYRTSRAAQFWALWIFLFLLPVLQLIPFPIWVADRYLYIPAVGGFVLASRLFLQASGRLVQRWQRRLSEGAAAAVVLILAWQVHHHLPVWRNDLTLWQATIATCPTSSYCHLNLGLGLLQNGQFELGTKELIRAVELRATPTSLERLGDAYAVGARDYRQAEIAYSLAIRKSEASPRAELYAKLARSYAFAGRLEEASRAIQRGKAVDPNDPTLLVMDGVLQWKLGNLEDARRSLRTAVMITGQASRVAHFIAEFWVDAAEVERLLADLRASP